MHLLIMKVVLTQNYRWDNAVYDIKPTFNTPTQLTYSLDDASTFNGGNEFRILIHVHCEHTLNALKQL